MGEASNTLARSAYRAWLLGIAAVATSKVSGVPQPSGLSPYHAHLRDL